MVYKMKIGKVLKQLFVFGILVFLVLPLLALILVSFGESRYLEFPPKGFSLKWYENIFIDPKWISSLSTSIIVALFSTIVSLFVGVSAAIYYKRIQSVKIKIFFVLISLSPIIIPSIIFAVSIFFFFSKIHLTDTLLGMVLGHSQFGIPLAFLSVLNSYKSEIQDLEKIAHTLGASYFNTLFKITIPKIGKGIFVGGVFAFITSFDEIIVSIFLSGTKIVTIPKRMWDGIQFEIDITVAAISTIITIIFSTIILMINKKAISR